ncbi:hypothetical protein E308F_17550 [Moorella sp. E308F]|uniref:hypothetical protein n=1 Tax=unclassified Neomoorella TaxID=2676739 RepID=UPI0010FFBAFB|nr:MULTISPECIES: hypothetical protein [unclassified Moorella (in: firmicutes)]GEA15511.1 hypothetical protein E308F_17550 [Moorella sp. E308F]GEA19631.1 hypothetical protein E306M_27690 [Moorella sp. E306M]
MGSIIRYYLPKDWQILYEGIIMRGPYKGQEGVHAEIGFLEDWASSGTIEADIPKVIYEKLLSGEYVFKRTSHWDWGIFDANGNQVWGG